MRRSPRLKLQDTTAPEMKINVKSASKQTVNKPTFAANILKPYQQCAKKKLSLKKSLKNTKTPLKCVKKENPCPVGGKTSRIDVNNKVNENIEYPSTSTENIPKHEERKSLETIEDLFESDKTPEIIETNDGNTEMDDDNMEMEDENKSECRAKIKEEVSEDDNALTKSLNNDASESDGLNAQGNILQGKEGNPTLDNEDFENYYEKHMEMLEEIKLMNLIDFEEIKIISETYEHKYGNNGRIYTNDIQRKFNYKDCIKNDVFFNDTKSYIFESCFKDRTTIISSFDKHSGHPSIEMQFCPYDINETPGSCRIKRFYRKTINDPRLNSWYQYNLVSSKMFSHEEIETMLSKNEDYSDSS